MKEFTLKSVLMGCIFGIIFGAANVYLALKAGLTVSASIPIAVMAITLGRRFFKTSILENNIIQTTGSAGESIASGVAFTLPGFLFLSLNEAGVSQGATYFNYWTILILAVLGGLIGTLLMIPLRKSLIVKEHATLPYPEGTACASVLKAGEKGGDFAKTAFLGLGFAVVYAFFQRVLHVISEAPSFVTGRTNKYYPAAEIGGEITPEYLGVGYIIGPRICGVLVAGGVLSWLALIPLLASLVPHDMIALQLVKLGQLASLDTPNARFGWDPATHTFDNLSNAVYQAYVKQIGAGAVAAGGFITLIKTIPTIINSFKGSLGSINKGADETSRLRTEKDLSMKVVVVGVIGLILAMSLITLLPGDSFWQRLLIGVLVVLFGAFFVTVSSRIVGLIGTTNNPVSGMTIATIMGTCLIFLAVGWSGKAYEPMALVVGGIICIAAANAGNTSQDLKTGFLLGATPRYQQIALFIGAIVSAFVVGWTVHILDTPTREMVANGTMHAIGTKEFSAPQATLMAVLIKGIQSGGLDWQFIIVGAAIAITVELCGISSLSFAVGAYLPLSTTLPIFVGGAIRGLIDWQRKKKGINLTPEEEELGRGNLFATGLVAGGAIAGVVVAVLTVNENAAAALESASLQQAIEAHLGNGGYQLLAALAFGFMGWVLYRIAKKVPKKLEA